MVAPPPPMDFPVIWPLSAPDARYPPRLSQIVLGRIQDGRRALSARICQHQQNAPLPRGVFVWYSAPLAPASGNKRVLLLHRRKTVIAGDQADAAQGHQRLPSLNPRLWCNRKALNLWRAFNSSTFASSRARTKSRTASRSASRTHIVMRSSPRYRQANFRALRPARVATTAIVSL